MVDARSEIEMHMHSGSQECITHFIQSRLLGQMGMAGGTVEVRHIVQFDEEIFFAAHSSGQSDPVSENVRVWVDIYVARFRVSILVLVVLPRVQQAIAVAALNCGAEDHRTPVDAPAIRARRHNLSHRRGSIGRHSSGRGPRRIVPRAAAGRRNSVLIIDSREGREASIETGKRCAV